MGHLSYVRAAYRGYRLVGFGVLPSAVRAVRLTWAVHGWNHPTGGY
jgi:hypothetical protein